jgi:hypothetical protein
VAGVVSVMVTQMLAWLSSLRNGHSTLSAGVFDKWPRVIRCAGQPPVLRTGLEELVCSLG